MTTLKHVHLALPYMCMKEKKTQKRKFIAIMQNTSRKQFQPWGEKHIKA